MKKDERDNNLTFSTTKNLRRSLSASLSEAKNKIRESIVAPLSARSSGTSGTSGTENSGEFWLPESLVDMLLLMQVDTGCVIPALISQCNPPEVSSLAECVVAVYLHEHGVHLDRLMKHCVNACVNEAVAQPETLFRGTSLEMRILSHYINKECNAFLRATVLPLLSWLGRFEFALEVDSSKESPKNVARNARLLHEAACRLLNGVIDNGELIPRSVSDLLKLVRQTIEKKLPDMADRGVASLLFLRLLNPALCSPDVYFGIPEPPAAHTRRTLILLSKLLQNLANGVLFGEKESYLEFANEWLKSSRQLLSSFVFDTVFGIRKSANIQQTVFPSAAEVVSALKWIHNLFCARKKQIFADKFLDSYFKVGADAKKRKATFVSQIRRATNNFHHLPQDDMPQEWVKELGLDKNLLHRSYSKLVENISAKKSAAAAAAASTENVPEQPVAFEEVAKSPVIGRPVLSSSDSHVDRVTQSPRRLNRGKSATIALRSKVAKKSVDETVFVNPLAKETVYLNPLAKETVYLNPLVASPSRVRPRRESLDFGGAEPMELSTPHEKNLSSPLKKHKQQRESIGESFSFTPNRK